MDSYQFYKSLFDRERSRRIQLDSAINLPLSLLTLLVAANSFILKFGAINFQNKSDLLEKFIFIVTIISIATIVFFLIRAYNNLFKGFAYRNFGLPSEILKYETEELPNFNEKVGIDSKLDFSKQIIERLTAITDNHILLNDQRSLDLYRSKTFIIITILITTIQFLIITIKSITI